MLALIRLTGLSVCLASGFFYFSGPVAVTASEAGTAKLTQDRVSEASSIGASREATAPMAISGKGDRSLPGERVAGCAEQAWPYISADCLAPGSGAKARPAVRTITVAEATGPSGASLSRVPAPAASRR